VLHLSDRRFAHGFFRACDEIRWVQLVADGLHRLGHPFAGLGDLLFKAGRLSLGCVAVVGLWRR
jgi:hypothetical protein